MFQFWSGAAIILLFASCAPNGSPSPQTAPIGNATAYVEADCTFSRAQGSSVNAKVAVFEGSGTTKQVILTTGGLSTPIATYSVNQSPPNGAGFTLYSAADFQLGFFSQVNKVTLDDNNQNLHLSGKLSDCKF